MFEKKSTDVVTEYIVRCNGQPIFSGSSRIEAYMHAQDAHRKCKSEGQSSPVIAISLRSVDYSLSDRDEDKVTEKSIN